MKKITALEIKNACDGLYFGKEDIEKIAVTSIFTDSRKIKEGSMFVAVKGQRADGHNFIESCKEKGAVLTLCEKHQKEYEPCIVVKSTLEAVKGIAEYYRSLFKIPFIGITGSVGKTSTKEMIYAVLKESFDTHKTEGNFNNELGVPLTIFGIEEHHQVAVIEMGISDFGEMTRLAKIVKPDICVITNIGFCHLENLVDRDGVLKAKTEMFKYLDKNGKIFLCGDDDKLRTVKEYKGKVPVFFGLSKDNSYYADNVKSDENGSIRCTMCYEGKRIPIKIPAVGEHMASNAMAAVAVGRSLGIEDEDIKRGVESYKTVGSRSNIIKANGYTLVDDCYNANPTSVRSSINSLMNIKGKRHVAVLGDMKELGEKEALLHSEIGTFANEKGVDFLITVGELAKNIYDSFCGKKIHYDNMETALKDIKKEIYVGDTVLIKASHSMNFEMIVELLKK
ncbi:MAG: UDP-N-acetylmuramoyl-tripeptide--D-alanyl-D-alanine ligase [Acutalibacteraceae bacterium]